MSRLDRGTRCSECGGLTVDGNVGLALQLFFSQTSTHGSLSFKEGRGKKKLGENVILVMA